MVTDFLLNPIFSFIDLLLTPLNLVSWTVDTLINIPLLTDFFSVIAYVMPWSYVTPLIFIIFSIIGFKIVISLIKTIWELLPIA